MVDLLFPALHAKSLGFEVIGTVPETFDHPDRGLVGLHVMYRRLPLRDDAEGPKSVGWLMFPARECRQT